MENCIELEEAPAAEEDAVIEDDTVFDVTRDVADKIADELLVIDLDAESADTELSVLVRELPDTVTDSDTDERDTGPGLTCSASADAPDA